MPGNCCGWNAGDATEFGLGDRIAAEDLMAVVASVVVIMVIGGCWVLVTRFCSSAVSFEVSECKSGTSAKSGCSPEKSLLRSNHLDSATAMCKLKLNIFAASKILSYGG